MSFFRQARKSLWRIHPRKRIAPPPRLYANIRTGDEVNFDVQRVYSRSYGRSPENIVTLMKRYNVNTVDELMKHLTPHRARRNFRERFYSWMRHMFGLSKYDMPASRHYRDLRNRGRAPGINRGLKP